MSILVMSVLVNYNECPGKLGPSQIAYFGIYHTGVYYTGTVRHGWYGDYSRPEKSVIRIYSDSFPDGQDIVEFSFNAGTVVEISSNWITDEAAFVVTTDASLPGVLQVFHRFLLDDG